MIKRNKNLAKLIAALLAFGNLVLVKPVLAASTDILVLGNDGKKYQYNIDQLTDSFIGNKKLYNDFMSKGDPEAYYDSKIKKYVDVEKIVDAFVKNSKSFDIDNFTESASSSDVVQISDTVQTIIQDANGNITEGQVITPESSSAKIVKVSQNTPVLGRTAVYVELTGVSDPTTYEVTVKGEKATYQQDTKQFLVVLTGSYSESDFSTDDIVFNNTQNNQDGDFDVVDIQ